MTSTLAVLDCPAGRAELRQSEKGALTVEFQPLAGPPWRATFRTTMTAVVTNSPEAMLFDIQAPGEALAHHGPLRIRVRLAGDADGVSLMLDAPTDYPFREYHGPEIRPLDPTDDGGAWSFLVPDGEGLILHGSGTGPGWRDRVSLHELRITLPLVGLLHDDGAGVFVIAVDGHDHSVDLLPSTGRPPALRLTNLATSDRWGYAREWRIVSSPGGGVVAAARVLTSEMARHGIGLLPRSRKLDNTRLPEAARSSLDGTVVWCHFDTLTQDLMRDLAASGLRRIRAMGRPVDDAALAARDRAGYAGGPYFQTYDVFPPGMVSELGWRGTYPPEGSSDGWPDDLIRNGAGWLDPAWVYLPFPKGERFWDVTEVRGVGGSAERQWSARHGQLPVQSYRRCPSRHRGVVDRRGLPLLESECATAAFYDIATAMWGLECLHPDHPCDRRSDVGYRIEALQSMSATGRAIFSEAGKWWGINHVSGFEGLLSYDQELNPDNMQLTDYPEDVERRSYEFDLRHRTPLFGLVARHAVSRTLWWGTGQDRHSGTWPSKDALTALYGANPIYVVDPDHPLTPGTPRWQRFWATAHAFDVLADLTPDAQIVDHQVEGAQLGWTQFDTGVTVEANVGFVEEAGLAPGEVIIRDDSGNTAARILPSDGDPADHRQQAD